MKRNLSHISVPFPPKLMSSSRNATNMPLEFAREIRNMITSISGAGTKRNGVKKWGQALQGENILELIPYLSSSGIQVLAFTESGTMYVTKDNATTWQSVSAFSTQGKIRYAYYANNLVLCNGVDDVMTWDGATLKPVAEWIEEKGTDLTYISANSFSVKGLLEDYTAGKAVNMKLGESYVESTVTASSVTGDIVTVTLSEAVLTADLEQVERLEKPPKFNFIYAAHDRLWGVGKGAISPNITKNNADKSFVFYTHKVGDENSWRNDVGSLQFIDLSGKFSAIDEVVSIAVKDGFTLFFHRNHIQIWSGYDPTATGDMAWKKTIPLGVPHGDLVKTLPNDIAFFTRYGVRTLSRILQTEQLDVSDLGSEIDPSLADAIDSILQNETSFKRSVFNFSQETQGWYGFHIAGKSYIFQLSAVSRGWSVFDGIFENVSATCNLMNGDLLIAKGGQVYIYDKNTYDDDNTAIKTLWWTPWLNGSSKNRWANKYTEVIAEHGEPILLNLKRFKNYNNNSYIQSQVEIPTSPDYWDVSYWDDAYFDYGAIQNSIARDAFISDVFSYSIETESKEGPLVLYGMKVYGKKEK